MATELEERDGGLRLPADRQGQMGVTIPPRAWKALSGAPVELRRRLRRLIGRREPYFILSGSDPNEAKGCCPSSLVGAANRLVKSGILASHRTPAAEGCTTTIYAFAGEIHTLRGEPGFTVNEDLRRQAAPLLEEGGGAAGDALPERCC